MSKLNDRTGEVRTMNNRLSAKITEYHNCKNIVVTFENGEIAKTSYGKFRDGKIRCPMIVTEFDDHCEIINPNTKTETRFLIDKDDLDLVLGLGYWSTTYYGYIHRKTNDNKAVYLHRLLMNAPTGMEVDHESGVTTDNRKSNLRICTSSQNKMNKIKSSRKLYTSPYKGVHWDKQSKRWKALVNLNGKCVHQSYHHCEIDAAKTYNKYALVHHGNFAKLNVLQKCRNKSKFNQCLCFYGSYKTCTNINNGEFACLNDV